MLYKVSIVIIAISLLFYSNNKNLRSIKQNKEKAFAKIENGDTIFLADTLEYKELVNYKFFFGENVTFEKVRIKKQLTLGDENEFYFLELSTKNGSHKVARWLNKIDDQLYLNDTIVETDTDLFEQTFLVCVGDGDCSPNVYEDQGKRVWGCGSTLECYISEEAAKQSGCESFKGL